MKIPISAMAATISLAAALSYSQTDPAATPSARPRAEATARARATPRANATARPGMTDAMPRLPLPTSAPGAATLAPGSSDGMGGTSRQHPGPGGGTGSGNTSGSGNDSGAGGATTGATTR
jgi:hypothetical protein